MIDYKKSKRITLFVGHYGSGKTNISINFAENLKKHFDNVAIADLDIVNPYFRTKDSQDELAKHGIRLICSDYAGTNLDIPALPQDMYAITDDKNLRCVIDVGGDDRGALALGRLAPKIKEENDYDMLLVVNKFRPLTRDIESTIEVMKEIELACGIPFTGIVNNSNLGEETKKEDIINSKEYIEKLQKATGLKNIFTSVKEGLEIDIEDKLILKLQEKIV